MRNQYEVTPPPVVHAKVAVEPDNVVPGVGLIIAAKPVAL
jgi:hypothetical protein